MIAKVVNDIRKTLSGAILDPEDKIKDVLDDNDFVSIVLETDRPNPSLEQAEVYICIKNQKSVSMFSYSGALCHCPSPWREADHA